MKCIVPLPNPGIAEDSQRSSRCSGRADHIEIPDRKTLINELERIGPEFRFCERWQVADIRHSLNSFYGKSAALMQCSIVRHVFDSGPQDASQSFIFILVQLLPGLPTPRHRLMKIARVVTSMSIALQTDPVKRQSHVLKPRRQRI